MRRLPFLVLLVGSIAGPGYAQAQRPPQAETETRASHPPGPVLCDRGAIRDADVAAILGAPIARHSGNPNDCRFVTAAGASLTVSWHPGRGNLAMAQWSKPTPDYGAVPVPGLGDRALWLAKLRGLHATKNDVLCDVFSDAAKGTDADLERKYGALCVKLWTLK